MSGQEQTIDTLLVGMGICGVAAAIQLSQGSNSNWLGIDKGRSVGGRMATRRVGSETFDHGAQFFTSRSTEFSQVVSELIASGRVKEWCRGFKGKTTTEVLDGFPRFMSVGGMTQMPRYLLRHIDKKQIILQRKIQRVHEEDFGFRIVDAEGGIFNARNVVLTAPVPQSLELVKGIKSLDGIDEVRTALSTVEYDPCIAIMGFFEIGSIPEIGLPYQFSDGPLAFVSDNGLKGISSSPGSLTIHLSAEASRECFLLTDDEIFEFAVRALMVRFPGFTFALRDSFSIHRWRYATPKTVFKVPYFESARKHPASNGVSRLFFAGEAFGGPKIEGAFLSGMAVGRRILEITNE